MCLGTPEVQRKKDGNGGMRGQVWRGQSELGAKSLDLGFQPVCSIPIPSHVTLEFSALVCKMGRWALNESSGSRADKWLIQRLLKDM